MYQSLDGRRAYDGDWLARNKRRGMVVFAILFLMLFASRSHLANSSNSAPTASTTATTTTKNKEAVSSRSSSSRNSPAVPGFPSEKGMRDEEDYTDEDDNDDDFNGDDEDMEWEKTSVRSKQNDEDYYGGSDIADDLVEDEVEVVVVGKQKTKAVDDNIDGEKDEELSLEDSDQTEIPNDEEDNESAEVSDKKAIDIAKPDGLIRSPAVPKEETPKYPECIVKLKVLPQDVSTSAKIHLIDIPKSGGTNVAKSLQNWVKKLNIAAKVVRSNENIIGGSPTKCPNQAMDAILLLGRGYGFCTNLEEVPHITVAVLRPPLPRTIALYDASPERFRQDRNSLQIPLSKATTLSALLKLYNSTSEIEPGEKILRGFANQQSKYLCGYECLGANAKLAKDDDTLLEKAKENLLKLDAVGMFDDVSAIVPQLKFQLGDLVPNTFTKFAKEREPKHSVLDEEAKAILMRWSSVDRALIIEAKKLFDEKQRLAKHCLDVIRSTEAESTVTNGADNQEGEDEEDDDD